MVAGPRTLSAALLVLCLSACDSAPSSVQEVESPAQAAAEATVAAVGEAAAGTQARSMRLWSRSCVLCHVDGNGGAPRVGNAEEWRARLVQGEATLLRHTIEGLNNMPPLGYCMACEREDFVAMIEFMTAGVTPAATVATPGDEP